MGKNKMRYSQLLRLLFSLLCSGLLVLLTACSSAPPTSSQKIHIDGPLTSASKPMPTPTTQPQTTCPVSGTARALVAAPLVQGNDQDIVYAISPANTATGPQTYTLKRYDVKTGSKTVILQVSGTLNWETVSPDGQWIIYTITTIQQKAYTKLQVIRVDGQYQQTLYCPPAEPAGASGDYILNPQISPDQKWLAFEERHFANRDNPESIYKIHLINLSTGAFTTAFSYTTTSQAAFGFDSWLDATHLYLNGTGPNSDLANIYALNITKGTDQQPESLTTVFTGEFTSFSSSYDRSHIYIVENPCNSSNCQALNSVVSLPAMGGTQQTLFQGQALYTVCPLNANQLLAASLVNSANRIYSISVLGDNGGNKHEVSAMNYGLDCYNPLQNASRDGSMYAVSQNNATQQQGLAFGSTTGGNPTIFAYTTSGIYLYVVGWTTI